MFVDVTCDHLNESCGQVLLWGTVYCAVQGSSNFDIWGRSLVMWPYKSKLFSSTFIWHCYYASNFNVCGWNPSVWPFKWKLLSGTFVWFSILHEVVLTLTSEDETLAISCNFRCYCFVMYMYIQGGSLWICGWNLGVPYFHVVLL